MMNSKSEELISGLTTAFIDQSSNSNLAYRPEFIYNDYKQGKKVLVSLEQELKRCDEFFISVAFITDSGFESLSMILKELEQKGVPGKILTTDYLTFSQPKALDRLAQLKNIELKMFRTNSEVGGFHTKGYIFREDELYRIIIGSSNMTSSAITKNREWNTKIVSTEQGEVAQEILNEFKNLWISPNSQYYEEFIEDYKEQYLQNQIITKQQRQAAKEQIVDFESYKLKPNKMQLAFINNLMKMRSEGIEKALLLSSTGTGKTYASAFAVRELGYQKVQTLSKKENLERFARDHFECCIYDEAHHTSADSYKKVMDYFTPQFTLGMTATPDKRDDHIEGRNIYEIFDHNIAYEIRLQKAMEEDLLCTFHYFGITDLEIVDDTMVNGNKLTKEEKLQNFRFLTSDERVKYVMEQAEYYGYSGNRVKGLIFCSRIEEANELSKKFNEYGWRTLALSGADSEEVRRDAIERLVNDDINELDYILSVDIFSEGVDVPEINQVIMLRPTQSPIVFIQQLGRGLRKAEDKEYVVILDFIGNYKNNFMIPIALSGDRSYNKDNVRRYIMEGSRIIPGSSTIHFDEISKKQIYQAIDAANFSDLKLIKENYFNLKNKLGRIPKLTEFDQYGEMDVCRIFDNSNLGSYYKFLVKYEKDYTVRLNDKEEKIIEFISKKIANGKRIHELELLSLMIEYRPGLIGRLQNNLKERYGITLKDEGIQNIINVMTNEFPTGSGKKTYKECILMEQEEDQQIFEKQQTDHMHKKMETRAIAYSQNWISRYKEYRVSKSFEKILENSEFTNLLEDLIQFGKSRYERDYSDRYQDTDLVLYQKYTYEDVCRLLNWENSEVPLNIGGYKFDKKTKTFPVFINYDKADNISDTTKYEDHFVNQNQLIAISKSGRSLESEDVQNFLHAKERGIGVQLFVRKNKDDKISKEFYYLGRMTATGQAQEFVMPNTEKTAVEILWTLDVSVREDLYEYIMSE